MSMSIVFIYNSHRCPKNRRPINAVTIFPMIEESIGAKGLKK